MESTTIWNRMFFPGKLCFARGYAARDAMITWPTIPPPVMIMVFRIYLEKGTQESFISVNKSEKFSRVGFLTKILGGN